MVNKLHMIEWTYGNFNFLLIWSSLNVNKFENELDELCVLSLLLSELDELFILSESHNVDVSLFNNLILCSDFDFFCCFIDFDSNAVKAAAALAMILSFKDNSKSFYTLVFVVKLWNYQSKHHNSL